MGEGGKGIIGTGDVSVEVTIANARTQSKKADVKTGRAVSFFSFSLFYLLSSSLSLSLYFSLFIFYLFIFLLSFLFIFYLP